MPFLGKPVMLTRAIRAALEESLQPLGDALNLMFWHLQEEGSPGTRSMTLFDGWIELLRPQRALH